MCATPGGGGLMTNADHGNGRQPVAISKGCVRYVIRWEAGWSELRRLTDPATMGDAPQRPGAAPGIRVSVDVRSGAGVGNHALTAPTTEHPTTAHVVPDVWLADAALARLPRLPWPGQATF
jgi:hypothetical protein